MNPNSGQKVATMLPIQPLNNWLEITKNRAFPLGSSRQITDFRRESESGQIY
jgi:hypothetical protein